MCCKTCDRGEVRGCDADAAAWPKHSQALAQHEQAVPVREVLDLVFAQAVIEGRVGKRESASHVQVDSLSCSRVAVGVQPAREFGRARTELQLPNPVPVEIRSDAPRGAEERPSSAELSPGAAKHQARQLTVELPHRQLLTAAPCPKTARRAGRD